MQGSTPESPNSSPREPQPVKDTVRSDSDIRTFGLLRESLYGQFTIGVTGGYAVDAHEGGIITRPHADMDAVVYLSGKSQDIAVDQVVKALALDLSSDWQRVEEKALPNLHFKGVSPDGSERRLELYLSPYEPNISPKVLIDSQGFTHAVDVQEVNELLANKIVFMLEHRNASLKWRSAKDSDVVDMQRLAKLEGIDEGRVIHDMAVYYRYVRKMDRVEAELRAENDYRGIEAEIFPEIKPVA